MGSAHVWFGEQVLLCYVALCLDLFCRAKFDFYSNS